MQIQSMVGDGVGGWGVVMVAGWTGAVERVMGMRA